MTTTADRPVPVELTAAGISAVLEPYRSFDRRTAERLLALETSVSSVSSPTSDHAPLHMRLLHRECLDLDKSVEQWRADSALLNAPGVEEWVAMAREACLIVQKDLDALTGHLQNFGMQITGPLATLNPLVFEQQLAIKQEQAALKEAEACSELGDDIDDDNVPLGIICASSTTHSPSVNAAALKQDEEIIRTPQLSKTSMALFAGKHGASGDDQRSRYTPNGGVRLSYSSDALSTPVLRSEKLLGGTGVAALKASSNAQRASFSSAIDSPQLHLRSNRSSLAGSTNGSPMVITQPTIAADVGELAFGEDPVAGDEVDCIVMPEVTPEEYASFDQFLQKQIPHEELNDVIREINDIVVNRQLHEGYGAVFLVAELEEVLVRMGAKVKSAMLALARLKRVSLAGTTEDGKKLYEVAQ